VAIIPAARLECLQVRPSGRRSIGLARFPFAPHALALDVAKVRGDRASAGPAQVHEPCLDRHSAAVGLAAGKSSRYMAATEAGARLVRDALGDSARLARLAQDPGHEGLAALVGGAHLGLESILWCVVPVAHRYTPTPA